MPKEQERERKRWSPVWKLFEKVGKKKASCKVCGREEDCSSNTSNLLRHLKTKHPDKYFMLSDPDLKSPTTPTQKTLFHPIPISPNRSAKISRLIAEWIACNNRPLSIVEDREFKRLFLELEPRYEVVSRTTLAKSIIPEIYGQVNLL
jgi:hypothetical protein